MVEELQKCCREEPPTPIFFNPGDLCAAQFSEDSCWYRAKVEEIVEGEVSLGGWGRSGGLGESGGVGESWGLGGGGVWGAGGGLGGWGIGRLLFFCVCGGMSDDEKNLLFGHFIVCDSLPGFWQQ